MRDTSAPFPSGIDASTGQPVPNRDLKEVLVERLQAMKRSRRDVVDGVDPKNLKQAGWGIIVAESDELVYDHLKALEPLLELRKREAGARYKEYLGAAGYRKGEDKLDFLDRHGTGPGRVNPAKVPYYLLLVGNPQHIPYEFQYGLDLHHAVGRIYFERSEEYAAYAEGVVNAAKASKASSLPEIAFFGPRQDSGTRVSNEALLKPLIKSVESKPGYQVRKFLGKTAKKEALARLLGGEETPDLLFSAGHGLQYKSGHERQRSHQGALVCQGWRGKGPPKPEHVFASVDLNPHACLRGLIAFLFACHSAGTPSQNDFACTASEQWSAAPEPFVSSLAQALLGHPEGGALAVIGHVHQVWQHSFLWRESGSQTEAFEDVLRRLLSGGPLGWAMEPLNQRFTDLSAALGELLKEAYLGGSLNKEALAEIWIASQDARNYVIVGDPAVRLPAVASPVEGERLTRG
jgi:hypothetical protein